MPAAVVLLLALALVVPSAAGPPGVTDTEILIGASASLSGPLAFTGEQVTKFGVDLYVRALDDAGGVHGRKVRTVYHDDGYQGEAAARNVQRLVEQDGVFAVVALYGTPAFLATADYLERQRVPLLFPLQGLPAARGRAYVFSGLPLYDRQARMMVEYLVGPRKLRTFAALWEDDAYGRAFVAALQRALGRHGTTLRRTPPVKPGAVDVAAQVATLQAAKPDVTFLLVTPGPAAHALKERRRRGWTDGLVVACGPLADERYLALAGVAAEGVEGLAFWPDPLTSDLPGMRTYREHMLRYFPRNEPNRYSLAGYVAAMLFAEGARRAGPALTRDGLVRALESVKDWPSGILPPVTIGADHEAQKQGFWVRLERGRFRQVTDWLRAD